jgi:hypothetical protein
MNYRLKSLLVIAALALAQSASVPAFGAPATVSQTIARRDGKTFGYTAAATQLLQGVLWARNGSGYIVNASDATGLIVVGIGGEEVDNSAGAAGDLTCNAERGVFKLANDSGTPVTEASINSVCYVLDNATVSGSGGTYDIIAGLVRKVDTDGVWVEVGARLDTATPADGGVTTAKLADAVADQITVTTVAVANTAVTPDGVALVTGQVKDAQGNALTGRFIVTIWFATSGAWAAPADLGTLTAKTNSTILKEDTDDAFARILTHSDGSWGANLDTASDGTVHVHATVGGAGAVTANAAITGN